MGKHLKKSEIKRLRLEVCTENAAAAYIGCKCAKFSGKPFKSGYLIDTIKGVGTLRTPDGKEKTAFIMREDETMVSCEMVYIL